MHNCPSCAHPNEVDAKFCGHCGRDLSNEAQGSARIGSTIVGRYHIKRLIASGGMGVVYEAEQSLGEHVRTVAIKMLLPELSHDRTIHSRFTRECEIVAQLTHQNTIRVYDFGSSDDGTLFIAMEYVRGVSLAQVISQGPFPISRALIVVEQMCHALHEAHELGIVHRDLKPDNVILTRLGSQQDFVKILDFGIAVRISIGGQHETKLTQQGMILGTPPYMSPEQFTGAPIGRQSDIYSLGIILYEMLTGHLPFDADNPWIWAQRHLTAQVPELPSAISPDIAAAVRAALAKNPSERPATALELLQRLHGESVPVASPQLQQQASHAAGTPQKPLRTEPDGHALNAHNSNPTYQRDATTGRGVASATEPGLASGATVNRIRQEQPVARLGYPAPGLGMPLAPGYSALRPRRRPWIAWVIVASILGLTGFGLWLLYWYDLIANPFDSGTPPIPVAAASSASDTVASASQVPLNNLTPETPDNVGPSVMPPMPPADVAGPHATGKPGSPARTSSTSPSATVPPSGSQVSSPANSIPWPVNLPSLPSVLPPLPSSIAALPSAILAIPLPPIFQGAPAGAATNPPPAQTANPSQ